MAVKREFGEKQPTELKDKAGPRNQVEAAAGKTDNIDNLVDNFLAELSDLSSEINQDGKPGSAASVIKEPPRPRSQEETARRSPDIDGTRGTRGIDDEIEKSLTELETLKAGESAKKAASPPGALPDKSAGPKKGEVAEIAKAPPPDDPDAQGWDRLEMFRNQISSTNAPRRRPIGIWAAVLVVAAVIAVFLVFRKEEPPRPPDQSAASQTAKPDPGAAVGQPVQPEIPAASANAKKENKPVNPGVPEKNKNTAGLKNSPRAAGNGGNEKVKASANGSEKQRSADAPPAASSAQKSGTNEETPRQVPSPAPAPKPAAEAPPVAPPPVPANVVPAKPNPVVTAENNTPAVPPANAPPRESPAEPKPAADVSSPVQARSRVPVMAEIVKRVSPDYPPIARSQKVSGKVEVEAEISEKGDVVQAKAVSGPFLLRSAAEQALMKWKFKPASLDGVNVPSKARISVAFNLQ